MGEESVLVLVWRILEIDVTDPLDDWMKELWDYICELYKLWGGDCKELPPRPKAKELADSIWALFGTFGAPDTTKPGELDHLLAVLKDIESHLLDQDNGLDSAVNKSFFDVIAAIRAAAKPS